MKLTSPPVRGSGARPKALAQTTTPGFTNPNKQTVIHDTGARSTTRDAQSIYELRCEYCQHRYGSNGIDVKARRCPKCQAGAVGEPLREAPPTLFG